MYIRSYLQDKQMTITLSGEINHHEAKHAMKTIREKIDSYLPRVLILDYKDVTFMDSSGLAIVISAIRRMREIGGSLILQNLKDQPKKVMYAAGIEKIVEIRGGVKG